MRLTQRVNYILLPVILLVFSGAALLIYSVVYQYTSQQLRTLLQQELSFMQREVDLEKRSVRAALSQVLNSAEMIKFLQVDSTIYQMYVLEGSVHTLLTEARRNSPGIEVIQVLKQNGEPLVSSDGADPFNTPKGPALPEGSFETYLQQIVDSEGLQPLEFLFQSGDGVIHFGILQPVSPRLLINDTLQELHEDTILALVTARLNAFERIDLRLQQLLKQGFTARFVPTGALRAEGVADPQANAESGLKLEIVDSLYNYSLVVPAELLRERLLQARLNLGVMVTALTIFSFFALRLLIQRQIVNPINRLVGKVRESHHENIQLAPLDHSDEVSELNNAYVSLLQDVHQLASFDHLTGLANRRSFMLILARHLHHAARHSRRAALLFIDLDNFKRVNDQYGHAAGDRLLEQFGEALQQATRPNDVVAGLGDDVLARLAGDEFALLLTDLDDVKDARLIAQRILNLLSDGLEVDGVVHNIQASIGIAVSPEDGVEAHALLRNADAAMYEAKAAGKNRAQFFNRDIAADMRKRQRIEKVLDQAMDSEDLHLVYMPIFDARSMRPVGAEVLLRCPALAAEGIGPDEFIPVAEATGLIKKIDLWVIERALVSLQSLRERNAYSGYFAINISAVELHNEDFPRRVGQLINKYGIPPELIELEITETSLVNNDSDGIRILEELKALGLRLSLDDFGTGYTAFSQLASYPVDTLKIDRSFVNDINVVSKEKRPMVDIILALADLYDLQVVAEGVETREQLDYLRSGRCEQLQGFFLSKPLSWQEMQALAKSCKSVEPLSTAAQIG